VTSGCYNKRGNNRRVNAMDLNICIEKISRYLKEKYTRESSAGRLEVCISRKAVSSIKESLGEEITSQQK